MKILIVGIDGGDLDLVNGLDMPFLQSLISNGAQRELTEDIISRGWAEILTGQHGANTRALYMRPKLDETYQFTTSFGVSDMLSNEDVLPIWDLTAKAGHKLGIMNVPTTGPAPSVDGFLVAGGGGGVDKVDGLSGDLFHPADARAILEENDYIVDLRLTSEGIKSFDELVDRLNAIVQKRAKSYIDLVKRYKTEVGFLCFRVSTVLQYLGMSEIQAIISMRSMPEMASADTSADPQYSKVQQRIIEHFRVLDQAIESVFQALKPENYIITSDHGAVPYLHHINVDAFLVETGYQIRPKSSLSLRSLIRKWIVARLSPSLKAKLVAKAPTSVKSMGVRFDPKRTRAFSNYYMAGIYINDSRRFKGVVHEGDELDALVDEICEAITQHPVSREYGISGVPYRRNFPNTKYNDFLPDIRLERPDTTFAVNDGPYVSVNERYGPLTEDLSEATDMHTGQKGRHPLFIFNKEMSKHDDIGCNDLTAVYSMLRRYLEVGEN